MNIRTDSFPLVAYPVDNAWAIFRDFETQAFVYVKALSAGATCQIASGPILDATQLGSPTTLTFPQAGTVQVVQIPIGGNGLNRATRVLPTNGRFSVTFVGPSNFYAVMSAPLVTTFGV